MAKRMCTGMAVRTCRTRARRSPRESSAAFHVANLRSSLSMRGSKWEVGTLRRERGRPKYWIGKAATGQARVEPMVSVTSGVH